MKVIKRDNRVAEFDATKIIGAILKAFKEVDGEISDYAMKNMNVVDLIQANIRGSEYTFGIAFCDTIKEAVLSYKCAALEKQMRNLKYLFKDVTDTFDNYEEKIRYIYIV